MSDEDDNKDLGEIGEKVTAEQEAELNRRIGKARTKLMARCPFFGYLTLKLKPRICRSQDLVDRAAVGPDGTLVFNPVFLSKLSDAQLCFVLAHEVMHPALLYFDRLGDRLPDLWNIAHDYTINLIIKQMATDNSIQLLDEIRLDEKYKDMSAEEVYEDLLKDAVLVRLCTTTKEDEEQGQQGNQPGQPQPGQGQGNQQQKQKGGKGQGQGKGQPQFGPTSGKGGNKRDPFSDPLHGDARRDLNDSDQGKKAENGDKSAQTSQDNDWKLSIVAAAQRHEHEKGRGNMPAGLLRMIDELINPKIAWWEKLARWVGEHGKRIDYTYQKPSRRSESVGQYMPSQKKYGFKDVVIMMDTSGSIGQEQLKIGLSEVNGICEDIGIVVRCLIIDAAVHDDVEVEDAFQLMSKLAGGGGSDFNPGFDKLKEEGFEGIVIAFTDGDIGVPSEKPEHLAGVMWCVYEGCHAPAKWGECIEIPKEEER